MSSENELWAHLADPGEGGEDPPRANEIRVLREFFEQFARGPNATDPAATNVAARQLMSLVDEDSEVRWEHADKGNRIGYLLWEAGINMPRHQPAILELVGAIQALPGLDMTAESEESGRWKDKLERWRSLEEFWEIWQDIYDRFREFRYPPYSFDGEGFEGFVNANSFYAHRLVRHAPWSACPPELQSAFSLIISTLEQNPWNHASEGDLIPDKNLRSERSHDFRITMLNTNIHALVPFFEIAGHVIYSFIGRTDLAGFQGRKYPQSDLWTGDSAFSKERWDFWKLERLRWVEARSGLKQRTQQDAASLIQMMEVVEKQGQSTEAL